MCPPFTLIHLIIVCNINNIHLINIVYVISSFSPSVFLSRSRYLEFLRSIRSHFSCLRWCSPSCACSAFQQRYSFLFITLSINASSLLSLLRSLHHTGHLPNRNTLHCVPPFSSSTSASASLPHPVSFPRLATNLNLYNIQYFIMYGNLKGSLILGRKRSNLINDLK